MTFVETKDYEICMNIRKTVKEHKKAQLTWGIIGLSVIAFLVIFIGCLYCLHRRNVRQISRRAKLNNPNVKTINVVKQLDAAEPTDSVHASPEKLLIKRSDV